MPPRRPVLLLAFALAWAIAACGEPADTRPAPVTATRVVPQPARTATPSAEPTTPGGFGPVKSLDRDDSGACADVAAREEARDLPLTALRDPNNSGGDREEGTCDRIKESFGPTRVPR